MMELHTVVKTVVEGLRSISQGVEAIAKKLEENFPRDHSKSNRKTGSTPKSGKSEASNGTKKRTATDTVLLVIKRSKTGVTIADIAEKTGYDRRKIANIVYTLRKLNKITSPSRGVYKKI
jgi:hypothetical protein